jgi:hypothetical protein
MNKNKELIDKINAAILELKSKSRCVDCGEDHPSALEFYFLNPKTRNSDIAGAIRLGLNLKMVLEKIGKVLCSNCHKKIS